MPKALIIWRDGRTRVMAVPDAVPMTVTVIERPPTTDGTLPPGRFREFVRAVAHKRAVIYEEPPDGGETEA